MTPQIKQRMEQIRRGEVPDGYKKTKIGIVPEEWEEALLGNYIQEYKELSNDIDKYPVYSSSRQGLMPQSQYYDNREAVETNLGYKIVPNGYVTYRHMSDDDVFHFNVNNSGGEVLVSSEYPVFTSTEKSNLGYIIPMLNDTAHFRFFCRTQKMGGTRTRLYYKNLCTYKSVYPPLAEQEKLAEILQTQDKVITLKEKLIEEKKRQKKYLMQQLLTGKKRLPGFDGEWKPIKLRKLLKERKTYSKKGFEYPHVTLSNEGISAKTERYDREHLVKSEDKEYKITHTGDICYNPANLKFGAICVNDFGDAIFSPIYVTFEIQHEVELGFLSNYLMRWDFINAVRKYEEGTVYERMAVKPEDFLKFEIMLPPIEEQKVISNVLSLYDREIVLLQHDLNQEKQKKKALMQLLLTGIVRT